jgi:hypothetical protein
MTHAEAAALMSILGLGFPRDRFGPENSAVYERAIGDLEAVDVQAAVEDLVRTAHRIPAIAELRAESARQRTKRVERESQAREPVPAPRQITSEPEAQRWQKTLEGMIDQSVRYKRMAEKWYREKGKAQPVADPGQAFIDIARAGARGEDVIRAAAQALRGFGVRQ